MLKNKKLVIIICTLFVISILYIGYQLHLNGKNIAINCKQINIKKYIGRDFQLQTCYGSIVVTKINPSISKTRYVIEDDKNGYTIAGFNSLSQYRVIGGYLYVKDYNPAISISRKNEKDFYDKEYFSNGKMNYAEYDKIEDIPVFNVVNIETNELKFYKNTNEMSVDVKSIFAELEKK